MSYSIQHIPIQTLVTGDSLSIHAHTFQGPALEPRIYLQANLHGPEIFGSALLIKLIDFLKHHPEDLVGSLTIVPQANPVGVQSQIYGYQFGRWNMQNGNNWNRIFSKDAPQKNNSIEEVLKQTLGELTRNHDIVLDIHTSGAACIPHLFTHPDDATFFLALHHELTVLVTEDDYYGAFDEYCRWVAHQEQRNIHVATWEASSHGTIEADALETQFAHLLAFLRAKNILTHAEEVPMIKIPTKPLSHLRTLHATEGGYFVWHVHPGAFVHKGETYGHIYSPKTGEIHARLAEQDFLLLIRHPLQAVASGQEIGEIVVSDFCDE